MPGKNIRFGGMPGLKQSKHGQDKNRALLFAMNILVVRAEG